MRSVAALVALAALAAGCGSTERATTTTAPAKPKAPPPLLRVAVVGPLQVDVPRVAFVRGSLADQPETPLVLADASATTAEEVHAAAVANPATHYAYVGGSVKGYDAPNLVGLVIRDEQAALLGGIVAGLVLEEQGGTAGRAAWVGPQENRLAEAFTQGVHRIVPAAVVLHGWSKRTPARCKEAALATIQRSAMVVMAHGGLCAEAVAAAAHEQNRIALSLVDLEFPGAPAAVLTRDAVAGVFRGGEDIVFGASSGAIGIRRLDPRISPDVAVRARAAAQELAIAG